MMSMTVEELLIIAGGALAAILAIAKSVVWVIESWTKHVCEPKRRRQQEQEELAHAPLEAKIDAIRHEINEMRVYDGVMNDIQRERDKTVRIIARALISLVTDFQVHGKPNGDTKQDIQALRDNIYDVSGESHND